MRHKSAIGLYLLKRLALVIPTILLATVGLFLVLQILPGDAALTILSGSTHTEAMRETLRRELGLDQPWYRQYFTWAVGTLSGESSSLETGEPIRSIIATQLPVTLLLACYTTLVSVLFAVPMGVVCAARRGEWPDRLIRVAGFGGLAIPSVWLSLLVLIVALKATGWSPPIIYSGPLVHPTEHLSIMVFPVLILSWEFGAHLVRIVRSSLIDVLDREFVVTGYAKGQRSVVVLLRYGLRNSLIPPLTTVGIQLGALIGGTIVVETVFGLPGVGRGLVHAALARDIPVVLTLSAILVALYLAGNIVVDTAIILADPRIRLDRRSTQ